MARIPYGRMVKEEKISAQQEEKLLEEEMRLIELEEEFKVTGVNQLKTQLESNIMVLDKKVKD